MSTTVFWRHIATESIVLIFNLFCCNFDIWFIKVVCCGIKAIKSKGVMCILESICVALYNCLC